MKLIAASTRKYAEDRARQAKQDELLQHALCQINTLSNEMPIYIDLAGMSLDTKKKLEELILAAEYRLSKVLDYKKPLTFVEGEIDGQAVMFRVAYE